MLSSLRLKTKIVNICMWNVNMLLQKCEIFCRNLNFTSTRGFISRRGAYWQYSSPRKHLGCFGHFVFMCNSSIFLFHTDDISLFFLLIFFDEFWRKSYVDMCGQYESRIVKVFSKPFNKSSGLITDILWWYRPSFYGGLCPTCFSRELGFDGSIFVFWILYLQ
jgi:hypothetical protein